MPYLAKILRYLPNREVVVEYVLDLEEDLYLSHHMFIYAPGLKSPSACLPVLPLAFGLEMMAEVAACLAPEYGFIGFENVMASKWIDLKDTTSLTLEISGQFSRKEPKLLTRRVEIKVSLKGQNAPALAGTVCLGKRYLLSIRHRFDELSDLRPFSMTPERLYRERHLFHGPLLHCISAIRGVGDQGVVGEIMVPSSKGLFRSRRSSELLTTPIVLDGLSQLATVLAMGEGWRFFPLGIEKLEAYCPPPPVGTRLPVYLKISRVGSKRISADYEVQDGSGMVWIRIRNLKFWIFNWTKKVVDYLRFPQNHLISSEKNLPFMPEGAICQSFRKENLHDLNVDWLARISLHSDEMGTFFQFDKNPAHQRRWLFGRVAAKDAVRLWFARQTSTPMIHPAAFTILKDSRGRPTVESLVDAREAPHVSIAHSQDRAIAIAHKDRLGIDIEVIEARDVGFLETFTTKRERDLLKKFPMGERDRWTTALWGAKEAVGKAMGTGFAGQARAFEADCIDDRGIITINHRPSSRSFVVSTQQEDAFIIALTIDGNFR